MIDVKNVSKEDFKEAFKALNSYLEECEMEKIQVVTRTNQEKLDDFIAKVDSLNEEGRAEELPEVVIDFYNTLAEGEPEEEAPAEPEKPKKEKKDKKEKKEKKPKEPKVRTPRHNSEHWAYELLKQGLSDEEIHQKFIELYTERGEKDQDFIKERFQIYTRNAKNRIRKEVEAADPEAAERNKAERKKAAAERLAKAREKRKNEKIKEKLDEKPKATKKKKASKKKVEAEEGAEA
jgi:hypothetical protein